MSRAAVEGEDAVGDEGAPRGDAAGRDAGQAFPLYITAVAALLFLALAFFAVGRAGATKNGAQTAADAAALAAAQDYRDQLHTGLLAALGAGGDWAGWLAGLGAEPGRACQAAASYAELNEAGPGITCDQGEAPGLFTVAVTSARTVGDSVVPGTGSKHAKATAKAGVLPRCTAQPPKPEPPAPEPPKPDPSGTRSPSPSGEPTKPPKPPGLTLTCGNKVLVIDPQHPGTVRATDLYAVRLAD
ncbi:pilus assembly protein TadG-related protein [Streptomyces sp. SCA3-4]|uniref:pilus assembly protein TadG-related protein n=1 Tax=Streptomyces sichuanensis TaxID=2871810 RepID=UPI001CE2E9D4|nr:pilus assembly protein TadG-related protein [Streptomyces sichuanensis]MCA6093218.1 pilus assembly protein TadG-related protein [Streptomyces sichuanensis]